MGAYYVLETARCYTYNLSNSLYWKLIDQLAGLLKNGYN